MNWAVFWPGMGDIFVALSLGCCLFSTLAGLHSGIRKSELSYEIAERCLFLATGLISLSGLILLGNLIGDNFLIRYVAAHSNRELPLVYKLTALWGGQDGSLLFWAWLAALYASAAVWVHRRSDRPLMPYFLSVLSTILAFFLVLLVFFESPFKLSVGAPPDGQGLNPLLQNPSMALHPPALYLGYVGLSVPFAFALSALISNQLDIRWILASRFWVLLSWLCLSIGNILGAQWAYQELGWGGFWGWDPVENAALMPWFTISAFLHSTMIQEKRGLLKFWNINLIVISFALTILGTYLTRSGVVQSVHSFAQSKIGYYFVTFLVLVICISAFWIFYRRKELQNHDFFESLLSKESAFVVNNIVLVGAAFIVFWCTLFPTFSEIITGSRIIVGPPFFNKMLGPLAIVLLLLTGIGPLISWRRATWRDLRALFFKPLILGICSLGLGLGLGLRQWYVLATLFGVGFVFWTIVDEFSRGTRARQIDTGESWPAALFRVTLRRNRKYGGAVVHLGMILIFLGIAGSAYKEVYEFKLKPGETSSFKEYSFRFQKLETQRNTNQEEVYAVVDLEVDHQKKVTLKPARFYYFEPNQPSTEVDIFGRLKEDVYLTLGNIDPKSQEASFHLTLNPLISFLWLGSIILVLGGFMAMLPPLKLSRRELKP